MVVLIAGGKQYPLDAKTKNVMSMIGNLETIEGPKESVDLGEFDHTALEHVLEVCKLCDC